MSLPKHWLALSDSENPELIRKNNWEFLENS